MTAMHTFRRTAASVLAAGLLGACGGSDGITLPPTPPTPTTPTTPTPVTYTPLRTLAAARSPRVGIGAAAGGLFNSSDAASASFMKVLAQEFDVLTPENELKFSSLRPARGTFNYARPDSMVAWAKANNMRVRGHTLAWHSQLSGWLTNGGYSSTDAALILTEHISNVVGHYKGQLAAWDVVNEAFTDSPVTLRSGFWSDKIGRGYIEQAFRAAYTADSTVPLYYNDYNIEPVNAKSDSVYALLADLKRRGVPVHGVGMQMHLIAGSLPSLSSMAENFARFAALGLKIQITELDIRLALPSTSNTVATQAQNYRDIYALCLAQPACDMVVTWGVTDRASWVPGTFSGFGEALLFDNALQPKLAYISVNNLLAGK
jgi:endo-1,4-beta-xylanase